MPTKKLFVAWRRFFKSFIQAAKRGIVFEVNYANSIEDSICLQNFISMTSAYCSSLNCQAMILNSGAANALQIRSPHDIISLHSLFNINENQFRKLLIDNPKKVLNLASTIRHTSSGMFYADQENIDLLFDENVNESDDSQLNEELN
ncbi:hypothetical protein GJ496_009593 [Pomphorhynchus laevis]|nr:hypothetical protein GJ496_009593 [Pomphorhynchus laevis]